MALYVDPNTGKTSATQDSTFSQNLDTWTPGQTTTPAPTPAPVATPASTAPVISTSDVVSPASDVASTAKKQQKDLEGIQTALQDRSLYEKTASDGFINAAFNAKYGRNANLEELGYTKVTDPKLLSGFTEEQLRREKDGSIYLKPGVGKASNYSLYGAKVIDVVKRLGLDSYLQDYGMGDTGKTDTATGAAPGEGETVEPEKPKTLLEKKEDIINNYFGNRNAERDKLKAEAGVAGIEAEINNASTIANQLMEKVEKMTTDLDMQDILNVETQIALKDKIEGRNIPMSSINSQLTKGMEDLTQDQRIKRLYDVYEVNTMINAQNAANRNVQLAQGKYDRAMETVREGIEDWATMQGMKLDLLTEMGQLEKEEKAKLQAEIDYERNLGLEGYTYVESTETYNKIVKELGITASTFSQFFYKDPANGKIYLKPSAQSAENEEVVNAYANRVASGQLKLSSVPANVRNAVTVALDGVSVSSVQTIASGTKKSSSGGGKSTPQGKSTWTKDRAQQLLNGYVNAGWTVQEATTRVRELTGMDVSIDMGDAEREMADQLKSVTGGDGFVSPDDYLSARNAWISAGFNPTTFDTRFKGFRNPNNPNYIINKQTTSKGREL